jgi:hypothetical protein
LTFKYNYAIILKINAFVLFGIRVMFYYIIGGFKVEENIHKRRVLTIKENNVSNSNQAAVWYGKYLF